MEKLEIFSAIADSLTKPLSMSIRQGSEHTRGEKRSILTSEWSFERSLKSIISEIVSV